ncbi:AraC family transcriptional regulator [Streptomyces sp. A7024]|uniref:AraC family transcriptional regulator n=1 Tax=Streptomyces coryli TaxID=1128680 RepID=A0A6G4TRA0_9ACTN|nr:AraC family transcriptional regulator [Streptomyces coryli]NGN62539.1 AraC family transcriptional regulator [Streptomyces coryli]
MDRQQQAAWLERLAQGADFGLFAYEPVVRPWSVVFPRGLPEHLVYLVVTGSCEGTAGEERIRLDPGSLMWLRPGVPFDLRAADPRQPITVYRFRLNRLQDEAATGPGDPDAVLVLPDAWELRATFDMLIAELAASAPYRDQRLPALLLVLFTGIFRLAGEQRGSGRRMDIAQRRLLEQYADRRITRRVRPEELARVVGLSPEYFTRRFRQTFGVPPKVWLVRRRIHQAALRLDEVPDSIAEVAAEFGYPDVFLFSRQFKAVMGMSPRRYRARQ